ncbi:HAD-IA family hydrolase [Amphritea japonica]|uniref:Phosphoglycolate phosphatase n=1 Tax=Amphritea japonica ATCC BAA-1530 TaxID=1278309 RepID=A0A7R6P3S3_9GAMM|nr:HAD-IA family hydrolase [Amphritea japonica]BBB25374.1 phosphoglycolate phosphatase [Amphritea japonica ATCC BAA-1530]
MSQALPAAVLFDLDGTLIDTAADFHYVINLLLAEHQRPPISYNYLRTYVSNGARAMVGAAFNKTEQDPEFSGLLERMLELYLEHLTTNTKPFPGITELLHWLGDKQIPWGIVTNKPEIYTTPIMQGLDFHPAAGTIICPDHVKEKKPHPEALFLACTELEVSPDKTVYIGDHRRDIEAGLRAGMQTIAVSYGYLDQGEDINSWNSHFQTDHAKNIRPILKTIYSHD